jgi:hypothetical protein
MPTRGTITRSTFHCADLSTVRSTSIIEPDFFSEGTSSSEDVRFFCKSFELSVADDPLGKMGRFNDDIAKFTEQKEGKRDLRPKYVEYAKWTNIASRIVYVSRVRS